jgi:hypothetical protein
MMTARVGPMAASVRSDPVSTMVLTIGDVNRPARGDRGCGPLSLRRAALGALLRVNVP